MRYLSIVILLFVVSSFASALGAFISRSPDLVLHKLLGPPAAVQNHEEPDAHHLHVGGDDFDPLHENVIDNDGRNRDEQSRRGRHERFRNSGSDHRRASGARDGQVMKSFDDSHHGAEEADEGSRVPEGSKNAQILFQNQALLIGKQERAGSLA